jgi:hypothetical protein
MSYRVEKPIRPTISMFLRIKQAIVAQRRYDKWQAYHTQFLEEMQALQERNEILESECANWKGEFNQTLEDIKGEIEEAEIVDGGYTGLISLSDTLAIIDKAKG